MAINRTKVLEAAQKHRRKGNLDKAIREYRTLMEDDPQDMRTLLVLADLYVKTQKQEEALGAYKSIAYHYLKDDIYDKAVGVFKQALNLDPKDPALRRDLGEAYHRMGRLKEAVGEYHHAQRLYAEQGDVHNQRDILERMVRLEPEEPALRIKLAEHYVRLKMVDEAVSLFEYAARQFEEDGRLDDYLKVMERIIFIRSKNTSLRKKVAQHYLDAREPQKALKHLRVCFEISNTDMETLRMMSVSFEQLGDTQKAVLVYSQLAKLHRDQGDAQRSHQIYEHILRLDPQNRDARKMLAYDARQQQQQAKQAQARPPVQPAQPPPQQVYELPEVEFLDDDLAEELGGSISTGNAFAPAPTTQNHIPRNEQVPDFAPAVEKTQQTRAPQKPAAQNNDLFSFAAAAFDDLGDIGIEKLPTSPESLSQVGRGAPPIEEIPAIEIEPVELLDVEPIEVAPEVALSDEELDIIQAIDESKVFVKYGLKDRALQTIYELVQRFPHSIQAREELARLYHRFNEEILAANQYIELAKLVRATPSRCKVYLEQAATHFGDRAQVEAIAAAENLSFGGLGQSSAVEEDLVELDLLQGLDVEDALSGLLVEPHAANSQPDILLEEDDEIMEIDDLDGLIIEDELHDDLDEFDIHTGRIDAQSIALEDLDDLTLDTDDVVMEGFEDAELLSIDEMNLPQDTEHDMRIPVGLGQGATVAQHTPRLRSSNELMKEGQGFDISVEEADAMFDNLFGDTGEISAASMSFSGSQDLGGLAEVDFLMDQGLVSEAEDALNRVEQSHPQSSSIQRRKLDLESMRAGNKFSGPNPFAASQSLSKQFAYNSVDEMAAAQHQEVGAGSSVPSLIGAGDNAVNTNFELGVVYMEMGLFDEALDEFRQALHDPDVSQSSSYNMALCEFQLHRPAQARALLEALLSQQNLEPNVRQSASALLARV